MLCLSQTVRTDKTTCQATGNLMLCPYTDTYTDPKNTYFLNFFLGKSRETRIVFTLFVWKNARYTRTCLLMVFLHPLVSSCVNFKIALILRF